MYTTNPTGCRRASPAERLLSAHRAVSTEHPTEHPSEHLPVTHPIEHFLGYAIPRKMLGGCSVSARQKLLGVCSASAQLDAQWDWWCRTLEKVLSELTTTREPIHIHLTRIIHSFSKAGI